MFHRKITYLDGIRLHRALAAGVRRVLSRQDHLNRINVFPVPDGDTGTNLSFTLMSILDNTGQRVQAHAGPGSLILALQPVQMSREGIPPGDPFPVRKDPFGKGNPFGVGTGLT